MKKMVQNTNGAGQETSLWTVKVKSHSAAALESTIVVVVGVSVDALGEGSTETLPLLFPRGPGLRKDPSQAPETLVPVDEVSI